MTDESSRLRAPVHRSQLALALTYVRTSHLSIVEMMTHLQSGDATQAKRAYEEFRGADKAIEKLIIDLAELDDGHE